jgi:choline monooxygenase
LFIGTHGGATFSGVSLNCTQLVEEIAAMAGRTWPNAVALPAGAYFSERLFQLEIERIFRREWVCVGHIAQLMEEGSYLTTDIAGTQVAVIRTANDSLSVIANSCAHRGAQILHGRGRTKLIVCRYHGWSYHLSGALIRAPGMPADAAERLANCRLPQLHHEVWNGFIYVTLEPNPQPLAPRISALSELVAPYLAPKMSVLFTAEEEWSANWKMLAENFMESYHLPSVHPQTVNQATPVSGVRCWQGGGGFTYHSLEIKQKENEPKGFEEELPEHIRGREILACIFPTHLLSVTSHNVLSLVVQPRGVERLRASVVYLVNPTFLRATNQSLDAVARSARAYFDTFNAEDKATIADLVAGLKCSLGQQGPLAPLERPLWEFHRYLAKHLCGDPRSLG